MRKLMPGALALIAAALLAGCSVEETSSGDEAAAKSGKSSGKGGERCGTRATDDCTPKVGENGKVRVDALYWQVRSVRTADSIGDMEYGLGEKADGVFVIVDMKVRSAKSESVTLTDNVFQLEVSGKTYDTDTDGTVAAIGSGEDPLFFEDIGPDASLTGKIVFDVPRKALRKTVLMRFNELGFGTTHAYITLSSLKA
jgi:hypothetical protein